MKFNYKIYLLNKNYCSIFTLFNKIYYYLFFFTFIAKCKDDNAKR